MHFILLRHRPPTGARAVQMSAIRSRRSWMRRRRSHSAWPRTDGWASVHNTSMRNSHRPALSSCGKTDRAGREGGMEGEGGGRVGRRDGGRERGRDGGRDGRRAGGTEGLPQPGAVILGKDGHGIIAGKEGETPAAWRWHSGMWI